MPVQSKKKVRRFLAEPIETSSRSSNICGPGPICSQPIFDSTNVTPIDGSKAGLASDKPREDPVLTSDVQDGPEEYRHIGGNSSASLSSNIHKTSDSYGHGGRRKFIPQLMETGKRSFRRKSTSVMSSHSSKNITITNGCSTGPNKCTPYESRFSYSSLRDRHKTRRHSFRVPDLPAIPSSCSEASDDSGSFVRPTSPPAAYSESVAQTTVGRDRRESCDENFTKYLLSIAARSVEKQLKEQALAAFPNEQVYQPVDHFAIDREDEEVSAGEQVDFADHDNLRYRRASSADLSWELEYMRQQKEEAEMRHRAMVGTMSPQFSHERMYSWLPPKPIDNSLADSIHWERECESQKVHTQSPPMLGGDLAFPQSLSPQTSIFEQTAGLEHDSHGLCELSGLWHARPCRLDTHEDDGLWQGTCRVDKLNRNLRGSLPVTFSASTRNDGRYDRGSGESSPPNFENKRHPQQSNEAPGAWDHMQHVKQEDVNSEFHDGFVTQIYNYLSIGYPCVARYYDHELSKVSGIPLADLRRDDLSMDAKGYVGVSDRSQTDKEMGKDACMRWTALRLYILEWAKEFPDTAQSENDFKTWGVRERRGSWAG